MYMLEWPHILTKYGTWLTYHSLILIYALIGILKLINFLRGEELL